MNNELIFNKRSELYSLMIKGPENQKALDYFYDLKILNDQIMLPVQEIIMNVQKHFRENDQNLLEQCNDWREVFRLLERKSFLSKNIIYQK
ncbi:hypothetical protein A0H76_2276 [Hepatospora eriocheir]|uniref:Uncharacterized protein n=1 Tax=Hepatospora eriocheir TaxID=1081669 RepID=A0A1X0QK76_9MICR|nr:hypothetical protein A0H76_2276 [Hepatospora eriocheir]